MNTDEIFTLDAELAGLRREYSASLPGKIIEIENEMETSRENARVQLHKLAGAAGLYGFPEVSVIAAELEYLCQSLLEDERLPDHNEQNQINTMIRDLHQNVANINDELNED